MRTKLNLAAAMAAPQDLASVEMTLAELILGFNTVTVGDYDWRLSKWIEAFGSTSDWKANALAASTDLTPTVSARKSRGRFPWRCTAP